MYLPSQSIEYIVEDRSAASEEGTLKDRAWVTRTSPLRLDPQGLIQVPMSLRCHRRNTSIGPGQDQYRGFYTEGVSDCSVVAVVELGTGRYYFEHVAGSHVTNEMIVEAMEEFEDSNIDDCYAVVAQYYGGTAFTSAFQLFDMCLVPAQNQIYYRSNKSGMAFGVNFVDGKFGEIGL